MPLRAALRILPFLLASLAHAQDQDVLVKGTITDALTGQPLPGSADVFDELDTLLAFTTECALDGSFEIALYSYDSGYYVLGFQAPGYVTRRAVLDMTGMNADLDADIAWEITMSVALRPEGQAKDASADDVLGLAVFDNRSKTIRWTTAAARTRFPVQRMQLRRLASAENTIDSLAREEGTLVAGIVVDHWTDRPLSGATVTITDTAGYRRELTTDGFGIYGITLPYDRVYRLRFGRPGSVDKVVEVDNRGIPLVERSSGFRMQVDMRLFQRIEGEDLSFLDAPIGRARYDSATNNLKWDMDHTRAVQERLQQVLDRHPKGK